MSLGSLQSFRGSLSLSTKNTSPCRCGPVWSRAPRGRKAITRELCPPGFLRPEQSPPHGEGLHWTEERSLPVLSCGVSLWLLCPSSSVPFLDTDIACKGRQGINVNSEQAAPPFPYWQCSVQRETPASGKPPPPQASVLLSWW